MNEWPVIHQSIHWPMYWPTGRAMDWLTDQPTNQPTDQLIDWPSNRPTNQPTDQSIDQPTDRLTDQSIDGVLLLAGYSSCLSVKGLKALLVPLHGMLGRLLHWKRELGENLNKKNIAFKEEQKASLMVGTNWQAKKLCILFLAVIFQFQFTGLIQCVLPFALFYSSHTRGYQICVLKPISVG